jgi:FMN reductase
MRVVGIGGTLRAGSTSERLARAVLDRCAAAGASTRMFDGAHLAALPHFNPEAAERSAAEIDLAEAVRACDALVIASPGYHGGVSGLVKNAIDLLEDLRGDPRPYFSDRAVGLIVTAAGWQAGGVTLSALRGITHAMRGWPTPLGIAVNTVEQRPFGADTTLTDPAIAALVSEMARQITSFRAAAAAPASPPSTLLMN